MPERNESAVSAMGPGPVIPASVTRTEVTEALKPLLDLLGLQKRDFFAEPGLTVAGDGITFTLAARSGRKDGTVPSVSAAQIGDVRVVGIAPASETGIDVTVAVR